MLPLPARGPALIVAETDADFAAARTLFEEYAASLGFDLGFQDFAAELENLRSMYAPPCGCLLLARARDELVGCVGVRAFDPLTCEMKRLYVRDAGRGSGVGRRLALEAIEAARRLGYRRMLLDTLSRMVAARRLYATLGFRETAPYYANPLADVQYLALDLETKGRDA